MKNTLKFLNFKREEIKNIYFHSEELKCPRIMIIFRTDPFTIALMPESNNSLK